MLTKSILKNYFYVVVYTLISFNVFSQTNDDDTLDELIYKLEKKIYYKEIDQIRYLSLLISKDSIFIFENDFSKSLFQNEIEPIVISIQANCKENQYISIFGFNAFLSIDTNKFIFENFEKSIELLSKEKIFFRHYFYNLNELISTTRVR